MAKVKSINQLANEQPYDMREYRGDKHEYMMQLPYGRLSDPCIVCSHSLQDKVHSIGPSINVPQ